MKNKRKAKEAAIKKHVVSMINDSKKQMIKKLDTVLKSGCIDIENYDTEHNSMLLPKAIICALLESEVQQYNGKGTSFEKSQKKEIKNIRYFI